MPHLLAPGRPPLPARPDRTIPLAAALLIVDLPGLSPEFDLVAFAEANPWAEVAVVRTPDDGVIAAWRRHSSLRKLIALDGSEEEWEAELRKEIVAVGPPEPKEVAAYVTAVYPNPTFARALLAEFRSFDSPGRSARHSAFKRRGPLTATGWMGLYTITRALSLPGPLNLSDAAARLGIDPRTLRDHFHRVLQLDWRDARQGFGWKWAVERTLRLHGYVEDGSDLPLAFQTVHRIPPPNELVVSS